MDAREQPDMNVYLVPVGGGRYALYCEAGDVSTPGATDRSTLWGRLVGLFHRALAEGDEERRRPQPAGGPALGRARRAVTRRLADTVAEQRLLWHLRHQTSVDLVHADDVPPAQALAVARERLAADGRKHRRWLIIDALLALASTPAVVLPGPNLLAYYFLVRVVGHYFSLRGVRQGLDTATWRLASSPQLTSLRAALALDRDARARHVGEIAQALGLNDLPRFVDGPGPRLS
jgi:Mitochondrial K+-H+ exchange-related